MSKKHNAINKSPEIEPTEDFQLQNSLEVNPADIQLENTSEEETEIELPVSKAEPKVEPPVSNSKKLHKALEEYECSYHAAIESLAWYLFPFKDFKDSNYKKAGKLYKLPSKQLATEVFFKKELSVKGYRLLSGHELNRLFSLAIRKVREHVKY